MEPENTILEKENPSSKRSFWGSMLNFGGVTTILSGKFLFHHFLFSPFFVFREGTRADFYEKPRGNQPQQANSLRLVLYELHIGSFTGGGSLLDAAERLIHIRDLGFLVLWNRVFVEFVWGGVICGSFLILVSRCIRVFAGCYCGLWIVCYKLLVQ